MRRCPNCGDLFADDRSICLSCGGLLSLRLTKEEEAALHDRIEDYKTLKDFPTTRFEKCLGVLAVIGFIGDVVLLSFFRTSGDYRFGSVVFLVCYFVSYAFFGSVRSHVFSESYIDKQSEKKPWFFPEMPFLTLRKLKIRLYFTLGILFMLIALGLTLLTR